MVKAGIQKAEKTVPLKKSSSCAVDVSTWQGATYGPREASPAINETKVKGSSGVNRNPDRELCRTVDICSAIKKAEGIKRRREFAGNHLHPLLLIDAYSPRSVGFKRVREG